MKKLLVALSISLLLILTACQTQSIQQQKETNSFASCDNEGKCPTESSCYAIESGLKCMSDQEVSKYCENLCGNMDKCFVLESDPERIVCT